MFECFSVNLVYVWQQVWLGTVYIARQIAGHVPGSFFDLLLLPNNSLSSAVLPVRVDCVSLRVINLLHSFLKVESCFCPPHSHMIPEWNFLLRPYELQWISFSARCHFSKKSWRTKRLDSKPTCGVLVAKHNPRSVLRSFWSSWHCGICG